MIPQLNKLPRLDKLSTPTKIAIGAGVGVALMGLADIVVGHLVTSRQGIKIGGAWAFAWLVAFVQRLVGRPWRQAAVVGFVTAAVLTILALLLPAAF